MNVVVPDRRIDELLAKQAIAEVLYRYCRAIDRLDRELALSCWHDGATVDYGSYQGPATGFVEWAWPIHRESFLAHSHQITNLLVEIGEERAVSEAYATVVLRARTPPANLLDIVGCGRYLDRWSKRDGIWAIDHRRHVTDLRSTYTVRETGGVVPEPPPSHRDASDPSYELFDHFGLRPGKC